MSRTTSRDLNGALLRGLFLGAHNKCITPSVDVQSVPRFTHLKHYGSQVYQKENPSVLAFMGSLCNATTPGGQPDRVQRLAANVPMQRGGTAQEVANAIVWLMSDETPYSTGSLIEISGGNL